MNYLMYNLDNQSFFLLTLLFGTSCFLVDAKRFQGLDVPSTLSSNPNLDQHSTFVLNEESVASKYQGRRIKSDETPSRIHQVIFIMTRNFVNDGDYNSINNDDHDDNDNSDDKNDNNNYVNDTNND